MLTFFFEIQYGLYSSFVGCFTYIFFGSTKSITIGPTAVLGIMTLSYSAGKPTEYAVLLSFLTGIVTLGMGIFRLGMLDMFHQFLCGVLKLNNS